ncbi:hypothetical protein QFC21_001788 [Naganishia friedmannii]|uniref:Uncharacterized protein n=1 Tax=Naganishia friedmannii TaxID=89922 RepID=A0ACC2W2U0_9TREE|nr:hypothetical protein QFC21_001788 [Naganishia friedmannii]
MYFYLSFLRPPPKAVSLAQGSVTITPQIANDLRTELKEDEPTDIYYTWQHLASPASSSLSYSIAPIKLTTYNPPRNTYKPLTIPLPAQAKPSQTWRLGLFSPPAKGVIGNLNTLNEHVCGVWSDGIAILPSNAGKSDGAKQTRVFREWQLPSTEKNRSGQRGSKRDARGRTVNVDDDSQKTGVSSETLKVVEQTSFDLDKKIWDSGLALSAWLQQHLQHETQPTVSASNPSKNTNHSCPLIDAYLNCLTTVPFSSARDGNDKGRRTIRALELGAGTGLVSFALASAVRRRWRDQGGCADEDDDEIDCGRPARYDIYATDLESALPLIDENAALNSHLWGRSPARLDEFATEEREFSEPQTSGADARDAMAGSHTMAGAEPSIKVHSAVLDWEDDLPPWVHRDPQGDEVQIDVVIAADVTYNTASFPHLIKTLTSLLGPTSRTHKPDASDPDQEMSSSRSPLLLLAYKERDASERELWEMARENGIWMEMVDVIRGHEASPTFEGDEAVAGATEIWIGGMSERP